MAVDIYAELARLGGLCTELAGRVDALELAAKPMRLGPVTYFRPGPLWDATLAAKPALTLINPGSGPGSAVDSAYPPQVAKCKAAGVPVLGYVHTRYGARPIAEVKADIDKHRAWYGISGIFIDTTSNQLVHLAYYAELCAYVKSWGGIVVLNPGTKTIEEHAQIADYVMVCETDLATFKLQTRPAWESKPAYRGKLWTVVHTCPAAEMPWVVAEAKRRHAGLIYVTDDVMANPYNLLPTYWPQLQAAVQP
jgi:hypothetical protein